MSCEMCEQTDKQKAEILREHQELQQDLIRNEGFLPEEAEARAWGRMLATEIYLWWALI